MNTLNALSSFICSSKPKLGNNAPLSECVLPITRVSLPVFARLKLWFGCASAWVKTTNDSEKTVYMNADAFVKASNKKLAQSLNPTSLTAKLAIERFRLKKHTCTSEQLKTLVGNVNKKFSSLAAV
jgi:hypothetical protein